jgi:hypothetical protein
VRLALTALFSLCLMGPAFADGTGTIQVGLVVTGDLVSPVLGTWTSKAAVESGTYKFEISGGSRVSYEYAAAPDGAESAAGCKIRVSAMLDRVDQASPALVRYFGAHHFLTPDYVVRYSINAAEALTASGATPCAEAAQSLVRTASATNMPRSLFLTKGAHGELIESTGGTAFARTAAN